MMLNLFLAWQCLFHVDICLLPYTHNHHDFNAIGVQLRAINNMHLYLPCFINFAICIRRIKRLRSSRDAQSEMVPTCVTKKGIVI